MVLSLKQKGKREAEDEIKKAVSVKKQKIVADLEQAALKKKVETKTQKKKKKEVSSSSEESSSESEEEKVKYMDY